MQFNKQSQKLRTRIQELEEELSRVKQQLHETSQEVGNHIFCSVLVLVVNTSDLPSAHSNIIGMNFHDTLWQLLNAQKNN